MSLAHFEVHQPTSLAQALDLLSAHRADARVLCGGTDLVPKLKAGVIAIGHLISLKRVAELDHVSFSLEKGLVIGGAARLSDVAEAPGVAENYPGLAHACSVMATTQIRHMGTVAGNLANAAPSGDTAAPLLVHDAVVNVVGPGGRRSIPLNDFFAGPGASVLDSLEIIETITAPAPQKPCGSQYLRLSARSMVDIAAVSVAALIGLDGGGRVNRCRLAMASVAPTPRRCPEAEALLEGKTPDAGLIAAAAQAMTAASCPIDDVRSSAAYRQQMVGVLTQRALEHSLKLAQGGAQ